MGSTTARNGEKMETQLTTQTTATGATTAAISASSLSTQLVSASSSSAVAGTSLSFPPGSLAISTSITIEEGASVATPTLAAELNLGTDVTKSGMAVTVNPGTATDTRIPFQLSIPLPISLALADDWSNLIVFYKVTIVNEGKNVIGIIPRSEIEIKNGTAQISTSHFGSFQTAITKDTVTEKKEAETKSVILTKQNSAALAPLSVTSRAPFLVKSNGMIEINGINFRPTMLIAMGGSKVSGLKVMSDSKASFVAPSLTSFGLTTVTVEQDGVSQSVSIFYAGEKSDLPISTKAEAEVCADERYYDANGSVRTGTRVCTATVAASGADLSNLVPANIKSGVTINGVAGTLPAAITSSCTVDGETNCLATTSYPAFNKTGAAAKIANGQVLGAVTGTAAARPADCSGDGQSNCVSTTNFPSVDFTNTFNNKTKLLTTVTVGGVTGTMPNCSDAGINCYVQGAFMAVSTTNLTASNIRSSVTLGNITGSFGPNCNADGQLNCISTSSYIAANSINLQPWNIRRGVTIGNVGGAIEFARGRADTTFFNRLTTGSTSVADMYDTVVDSVALPGEDIPGFPTFGGFNTAFTRDAAGDSNTNGICDAGEDCVYKDQMTKNQWAQSSGAANAVWDGAITACLGKTYGGLSGWRLPTQKEMMQGQVDGIFKFFSATDLNLNSFIFWTATTNTPNTYAMTFNLGDGGAVSALKTTTHPSICVR